MIPIGFSTSSVTKVVVLLRLILRMIILVSVGTCTVRLATSCRVDVFTAWTECVYFDVWCSDILITCLSCTLLGSSFFSSALGFLLEQNHIEHSNIQS